MNMLKRQTDPIAAAAAAPLGTGRRQSASSPPRRGFSLVELIVVVALITMILVIAVPTMSRMMSDSRVEASRGAIASTVATARAWAPIAPPFPVGNYRGTAAIFTPANEIRVARHVSGAADADDGTLLVDEDRAGYADLQQEPYGSIPRGVGVVGIARSTNATVDSEPLLLTPPFAVRFNPSGMLIPAQAGSDPPQDQSRIVFYDHDNSGDYDVNRSRYDGYDVDEWDPETVGRRATTQDGLEPNWDEDYERYLFDFGRLEAVVGVIVFDKSALRSAGFDFVSDNTANALNPDAADWILHNGRPLFFNRYSGSGIKP